MSPDQPISAEVAGGHCGFTFYVRGGTGHWMCAEKATQDVEFMGEQVKACRRHSYELRCAKYEERADA